MSKSLNLLTGKWVEEKKPNKAPEALVGRQVDSYIESLGGYIRTIKSDGTKMGNGRWRKSAQGSGISDRIAFLPQGIFIAIELKAKGKKATLSEPQYYFLRNLIMRGHKACVSDSVDDVKRALEQDQDALSKELEKWNPLRKVTPASIQTTDLPW